MTDYFPDRYFPVNYFAGSYFTNTGAVLPPEPPPPEELPRRSSSWIIHVVWRPVERVAPAVTLREYVRAALKEKPKNKKKAKRAAPTPTPASDIRPDFSRLASVFSFPAPPRVDPAAFAAIPDARLVAPEPANDDQDLALVLLLAA